MDADRIERIAAVTHDQWVAWSRRLAAKGPRVRWWRLWVPYEAKEVDRETARKIVQILCEDCEKNRTER
jgi:hypothetical protein